jgi:membrane-bound acyltransferase YfiQ involved in biofilm formation
MGKSIIRGVAIGVPVALVGLTLAVWLITDQNIFVSFTTALLPGILLGAFSGGFVGMTSAVWGE